MAMLTMSMRLCIGYDETLGVTLTNECSVSQFIDDHDPIRLLTDTTSIKFLPEDDVYREHKDTSNEIVTCLSDLKVCKSDGDVERVCICGCNRGRREGSEDSKLIMSEPLCCSGARLSSGKPTGSQSVVLLSSALEQSDPSLFTLRIVSCVIVMCI